MENERWRKWDRGWGRIESNVKGNYRGIHKNTNGLRERG